MEIKTKINKWDLIKLENFFTANEAMNKMKRQPTDWEKIFANDATNKGLIKKIYIYIQSSTYSLMSKQNKQNNPGQKT